MHRPAKLTSSRLSPLTRITGLSGRMNRSFDRYIKAVGARNSPAHTRTLDSCVRARTQKCTPWSVFTTSCEIFIHAAFASSKTQLAHGQLVIIKRARARARPRGEKADVAFYSNKLDLRCRLRENRASGKERNVRRASHTPSCWMVCIGIGHPASC